MPHPTYYAQDCPTCGRRLQIRVEFLGKKVECLHCSGDFIAADSHTQKTAGLDTTSDLMQRADDLLMSCPSEELPPR